MYVVRNDNLKNIIVAFSCLSVDHSLQPRTLFERRQGLPGWHPLIGLQHSLKRLAAIDQAPGNDVVEVGVMTTDFSLRCWIGSGAFPGGQLASVKGDLLPDPVAASDMPEPFG